MALATAVAWALGNALGAAQPTFAALAVVLTLQGYAAQSLRTAGQRVLGVAGGVGIGLAALHGPGLGPPVAGALIFVALVVGSFLRLGGKVNTQVAISALLLLAGGGGWRYGLERLWETALGGAVAVVASLAMWPSDPLREAEEEARRLARALAGDLRGVAGAAGGGEALRRLWEAMGGRAREADRLWLDFPETAEALRWAPWHDRGSAARLEDRLRCLAALYRHARHLARAAGELPAPSAPLRAALEDLARAVGALADPQAATVRAAGDLLAALPARLGELLRQGGEPLAAAAAASEIRHLAADLEGWLGTARDAEPGSGALGPGRTRR